MAFTDAQQEAIDSDDHVLIVAGPGTGKTTTSVGKAQRILSNPNNRLLMTTFTKDGSEEMRKRIDAAQIKTGQPAFSQDRLLIATFNSITIRHLYSHRAKEKVLSPAQQSVYLNELLQGLTQDEAAEVREGFERYMHAIDRDALRLQPHILTIIEKYNERLKATRATDLYAVMRDCAMLCADGSIPTMPFTHMIVDEAQDTDQLQRIWIFAHAYAGIRVSMVGDDDQSIYEWRNALGYSGMQSFLDTFKAQRVELNANYRSRQEILSHAVLLIEHNSERLQKNLMAMRGPGGTITAYHTPRSDTQCSELAELIANTPLAHKNTVVLARTNRSLNDLEMCLTENSVHYERIGKSIWEDSHVSMYLCLLESLLTGSPVGVFGCLSLIGLDEKVRADFLRAIKGNAVEFMMGNLPDLSSATAGDMKVLEEFSNACKYWRKQLMIGSVNEVVLDTGQWFSGKQRKTYVREVITRSALILSRLRGTLPSRLHFISTNKKGSSKAPVTLMTMHGSKGLEFDTVHVIDASKPESGSDVTNEEAERRLMFVAMTRAKDRFVAWFSGVPHPSLIEAQLPVLHEFDELQNLMEMSYAA